jgi:hypothetical protein
MLSFENKLVQHKRKLVTSCEISVSDGGEYEV